MLESTCPRKASTGCLALASVKQIMSMTISGLSSRIFRPKSPAFSSASRDNSRPQNFHAPCGRYGAHCPRLTETTSNPAETSRGARYAPT
jgi:hypothetical protein